jgi:hypothetical protein
VPDRPATDDLGVDADLRVVVLGGGAQDSVSRQIVVDAPIERAFAVFTDRFGDFKPPEHNSASSGLADTGVGSVHPIEHRAGLT